MKIRKKIISDNLLIDYFNMNKIEIYIKLINRQIRDLKHNKKLIRRNDCRLFKENLVVHLNTKYYKFGWFNINLSEIQIFKTLK